MSQDPLKKIYQDISNGLEGIEKELRKKERKGQCEVLDAQNI